MTDHQQGPESGPQLSPDDVRVLDELAAAGFDPAALDGLAPADRERGERLLGMFGLLEQYTVEPADDVLVDATLARIDQAERRQQDRMRLEPAGDVMPRRRLPLPDIVTAASIALIAASVIWPTVTHLKKRSIDLQCQNNLRQLGDAFAMYARSHDGSPPVMTAGLSWDSYSHTDNLQPLVDGGYCDAGCLNCPGHHHPAGHDGAVLPCSYSYQWQVPKSLEAAGEDVVLLGDLNPLVQAARSGGVAPAFSLSVSHGGRGQFVLLNGGATLWLETPLFRTGDNIWLPHGEQSLRAGTRTEDARDSFLVH